MYSEQELTKIIKEVSEAYIDELIEGGEFDQAIADYVDAYLVEHPVDITALEGQTINPARINVANINGESNPSVKPVYCHPLNITNLTLKFRIACLIFNNSSTAFTKASFKTFIDDLYTALNDTVRIIITGAYEYDSKVTIASVLGKSSSGYFISGSVVSDASTNTWSFDWDTIFTDQTALYDGVNKIN